VTVSEHIDIELEEEVPGPTARTSTRRAARRPIAADAPVAISVEQLGVKYELRLTKKPTMRGSLSQRLRGSPAKSFWALRNVSFEVRHGESLGVIGPNGAGKSTLLQVLAGIIVPSEGEVMVDGHISSLLTLGVGFDQDLSGTDNIRLAGAFMGIDHREVEEKLPGIVNYADLGEFIDAPIKTYSSGMRARLGFAIATSVEPDILILDEVLSTGDAAFREKSKQRVAELLEEAKAIVLVTHDMNWVREYCTRAILLERGRIIETGAPDDVVRLHQERSAQRKAEATAAGVFKEARERSAKAARRRQRRQNPG
jgi:ABC-type polysaccharide/polyol phosphate transport system ATPase subunit